MGLKTSKSRKAWKLRQGDRLLFPGVEILAYEQKSGSTRILIWADRSVRYELKPGKAGRKAGGG